MLSSNLQWSQLPLSGMYCFRPSSFNDWLGILLLALKDGNGIFCLLDPERQRKLETLFIQPQDMGTYRTLSLSKELLFLFSFSACVGSICLMDFSQTVCYQLWTSVSGLHMAVSWKKVLCSCMQIIMLLDGRNCSRFDQKASPLDLLLTFLIRMCVISEHFWSLLHQCDDGC